MQELRRAGRYLSRKTSFKDLLQDSFQRLWILSDPYLRTLKRKVTVKKRETMSDPDDRLVKSFIKS